MDKNLILTSASLVFGIGYVGLYMLNGRNENPLTYKYNELFKNEKRINHITFALIFAVLGVIRYNSLTLETYYFSPILFIISLYIFNYIIKLIYKRNILIEIRGSAFSSIINKRAKFMDKFFGFLILLISMAGPLIMKYDKFDEINAERRKFKKEITAYNSGLHQWL
ncbi:hypothetical protein [Flavobacterium sp.]|uniref:hypothetical protein n=1 Tax=Flavobacterium sp. TaxID=239 RepID=UPI002B4AE745|nr:hypothetical protein [Flavobacterium sp.]HLF53206.1 hypothetical protein [Flavobacterium sp.]